MMQKFQQILMNAGPIAGEVTALGFAELLASGQIMAATLGWTLSVFVHFSQHKNRLEEDKEQAPVVKVKNYLRRRYDDILVQAVSAYALVYVGLDPLIHMLLPDVGNYTMRFSSFLCGLLGAQLLQMFYSKYGLKKEGRQNN